MPVFGLQPVLQVELGFAEKLVCAFAFQLQKLALDGTDAGGGNVAIAVAKFGGVFGNVLQHAAQVFKVNQMPAFVVRHFEYEIQHTFLRVV